MRLQRGTNFLLFLSREQGAFCVFVVMVYSAFLATFSQSSTSKEVLRAPNALHILGRYLEERSTLAELQTPLRRLSELRLSRGFHPFHN